MKICKAVILMASILIVGQLTPGANLLVSDAHAKDDDDDRRKYKGFVCESRKLEGRYGFNSEGYNRSPQGDPSASARAIGVVGVLSFDRHDGVKINWRSDNRISTGRPARECSGIYEVDRDCRGSAEFSDEYEESCPGPGHIDFVVTDCGKDVHFLFVDQQDLHTGDFHISGDAHRIDGRSFCKDD